MAKTEEQIRLRCEYVLKHIQIMKKIVVKNYKKAIKNCNNNYEIITNGYHILIQKNGCSHRSDKMEYQFMLMTEFICNNKTHLARICYEFYDIDDKDTFWTKKYFDKIESKIN